MLATGFNRYMVECELTCRMSIFADNKVLIDTWWNVNLSPYKFQQTNSIVLIDTWWNVNKNANLAFMEIFAF